jgi:hypothetical protein
VWNTYNKFRFFFCFSRDQKWNETLRRPKCCRLVFSEIYTSCLQMAVSWQSVMTVIFSLNKLQSRLTFWVQFQCGMEKQKNSYVNRLWNCNLRMICENLKRSIEHTFKTDFVRMNICCLGQPIFYVCGRSKFRKSSLHPKITYNCLLLCGPHNFVFCNSELIQQIKIASLHAIV